MDPNDDADRRRALARGLEKAGELYTELGPFTPDRLRAVAESLLTFAPDDPLFRGVAMGYRVIAAALEDGEEVS